MSEFIRDPKAVSSQWLVIRRLFRIFAGVGVLTLLLSGSIYYALSSHTPTVYIDADVQGQTVTVTGAVRDVTKIAYSCLGKPSVCTWSVNVIDLDGNILLEDYWLEYGITLVPGQPVTVLYDGNTALIEDYPYFTTEGRAEGNLKIFGWLGALFFAIGIFMRLILALVSRR
ncbi:hypothetical protein GCM10017044_12350 [Kordiimonas sediminis]|uniref:Uncharacterized protein n=1 Tax=Kordiimonas sediminis TaxID=1735581 RepID=A0A919AQ88_9PROT|nr:hypothetical protein [Kordiimonas sediminis]GHF19307.1 hypothetical protein GCM10017044_12350 [Kordiimonas sediminis]